MTTYRIRDWARNFENNRTRELKKMDWVPVPNKHDGDGFTELLDHENGMAHYGAWHLILQVASKCDPRGTLLRDGAGGGKTPHTPHSLARITRGSAAVFGEAIGRLVNIGWLETCDNPAQIPHNPAPACGLVTMEWNGMEGNGKNGSEQTTTTDGDFEASHPEFKQLTESMEFRCVTHEQYLLILKAHPAVDRQAAITRALSDAVLETSGISAPAKFLKERFRRLEMDGQTVRPENETREQRAERLDRAIRRGAR
jgi:hypothetical protein